MSSSTQAVKTVRKLADIRSGELIAQPYLRSGVEGDLSPAASFLQLSSNKI
jgi:hypothetical protein